MSFDSLNNKTKHQAIDWFSLTCTASKWCERMADARPFSNLDQILNAANEIWGQMEREDILEAFAGHPMIGDIDSLKAKYANTQSLAKNEQGGMDSASEEVFHELKQCNQTYLDNHGFIFIICASGLSAEQMLEAIKLRVNNTSEQEFATAAAEQLKITKLRVTNALPDMLTDTL